MDIVKTFGRIIAENVDEHPMGTRRLLLTGYGAQQIMLKLALNKNLPKSRQYIASEAMRVVRTALSHPERACATSLFAPTEFLHAAGVTPYSVEQLSAFLAGTKCEQKFLQTASENGISETLCSYHRTFLGAMESDLLPRPAAALYTSIACDANVITFPHIKEHFKVPAFFIDVPWEKSEDSVAEVVRQLRQIPEFLGDVYGATVTEDALRERVASSARTAASYNAFLDAQKQHRRLQSDLTSEMYALLAFRIMMGSPVAERFAREIAEEQATAPKSNGLRIVWIHTIPNMLTPAVNALSFNDHAYITACDLVSDSITQPMDPMHPYESMARRLVYSIFNGSCEDRVEHAKQLVERTGADGVVIFTHWGCKMTLGASQLIKTALDHAGIPCLVLDGDACDRVNTSEGQAETRLNAFLEMLDARRSEAAGNAEEAASIAASEEGSAA